jgi:hypothetical protein
MPRQREVAGPHLLLGGLPAASPGFPILARLVKRYPPRAAGRVIQARQAHPVAVGKGPLGPADEVNGGAEATRQARIWGPKSAPTR